MSEEKRPSFSVVPRDQVISMEETQRSAMAMDAAMRRFAALVPEALARELVLRQSSRDAAACAEEEGRLPSDDTLAAELDAIGADERLRNIARSTLDALRECANPLDPVADAEWIAERVEEVSFALAAGWVRMLVNVRLLADAGDPLPLDDRLLPAVSEDLAAEGIVPDELIASDTQALLGPELARELYDALVPALRAELAEDQDVSLASTVTLRVRGGSLSLVTLAP